MKIAMIGQKGIPAKFGGIERHVAELSERLAASGAEVSVYCRRWYATEAENTKVKQIFTPTLHTKNLDAIIHTFTSTLHAIFIEKPDIIHYHGVGPALLAWMPRLLSPKTRVVVTFHCIDRTHDKWGNFARIMLRMGEWSACGNADRTITVSETLKRYCNEAYETDTALIPNGVTILPEASTSFLNEWNLVPGKFLLFIGRIIRLKGLHTLLTAYRNLPEAVRNEYPLVIVGEGYYSDSYLKELTVLAKGLPIKFIGNQTGEPLACLFRYAAAMVQPSETEGMPMVVLEAAGVGTPVIASSIPAHREILGENGNYFAVKNSFDLTRALMDAVGRIDELKLCAKNFAPHINKKYSWDKISGQTMEIYLSTARPVRVPVVVE
jgi:glycosyltransferase involved in cell wall biosynthesis